MGAPPGNKYALGNPGGGRPTLYKPEYAQIAKAMCELGATNADLADEFGVTTQTIQMWQCAHKEFNFALKVGKGPTDDKVERSLYQRANGYSFDSVKIFNGADGPVIVPYREHCPPDTAAAFIWLKNRRRDEWRDRHETVVDATLDIRRVTIEGGLPTPTGKIEHDDGDNGSS